MTLSSLAVQPSVQFRQRRDFYPVYDGVYLAFFSLVLSVMYVLQWQGVAQSFEWWMAAVLPVLSYGVVLCNVFVHNCTHGNFPRAINRLVGEVCGMVVLTRYASWEIIHRRHHKFSDDPDKDPHPVHPNFWVFALRSFVTVERQLQQQFFEIHGDTPENHQFERNRALMSFVTSMLGVVAWYFLWGPYFFFAVFAPASVIGILHLLHFNWVTHNPKAPDGNFHPINIDTGILWLMNRLCFGIYFHGNHHKQANLFNPRFYDQYLEDKRARLSTG